MSEPTDDASGLSRRSMLKKSVVAGGVVWVAPTVLSNVASASTTDDCVGGMKSAGKTESGITGCNSNQIPASVICREITNYSTNTFDSCDKVSFANSNVQGNIWQIDVAPGQNCTILKAFAKQGPVDCYPFAIAADGKSAIYREELSHIQWELCCRVS